MTQQTTFTPSGTETLTFTPPQLNGATFAMPSVDVTNPDALVVNNSSAPVLLSFATSAAPVGPNVGGNVQVLPGQALLLTSKAAVLAAAAANAAVIGGGQGAAVATATFVSALALQPVTNGQITVTRGVAATAYVF